jgi:UDP-glucose 4-epimerase
LPWIYGNALASDSDIQALEVLGWKAERGLEDMCRDAWAWQSANPTGFPDA